MTSVSEAAPAAAPHGVLRGGTKVLAHPAGPQRSGGRRSRCAGAVSAARTTDRVGPRWRDAPLFFLDLPATRKRAGLATSPRGIYMWKAEPRLRLEVYSKTAI